MSDDFRRAELADRERQVDVALAAAEEELLAALGDALLCPGAEDVVDVLRTQVEAIRVAREKCMAALTGTEAMGT